MNTFTIPTNVKVGKDEGVSRYNWTQEVVDSVLEQTKDIIEQDKMFVESLDNGTVTETTNFDKVCGTITNAYLSEDSQIIMEVRILDSPMGNILSTLMEACGEALQIGVKMVGTVNEDDTPESVKVLGAYFDHKKRAKNDTLI